MSASLVAMFATALHQVNAAAADPESMEEALVLLTRAANGAAVVFETLEGRLYVNDVPMPDDAPGVSHVIKALDDHGTTRLALPAKLDLRHWREVCEVFASVPALYPTADEIRDALRASVPAAVVSSRTQEPGYTDLREAMFEIPGLMTDKSEASNTPPPPGFSTRSTDRAELSTRLDPILKDAAEATAAHDYEQLARLTLEMVAIGEQADEATRTIIARERRRMVPQSTLSAMVRQIPRPETSPVVTKAVMAMGRDGVEALIDAMNGAPSGFERRVYVEALTSAPNADEPIIASLGSARAELVRDAADVAGRRRMEAAIPALGHLLKHDDEKVRTAAWQALERIGTSAALDTLYGQPIAGRSRSSA